MNTNQISKGTLWTSRIMSGIVILFMLFDATLKFIRPEAVIQATGELGYKEHHILVQGLLALIPTILYAIPRTSVFGAILLTALFGGAMATHLRVDNPLFSHLLFPVYLAILMWGGIWLRERSIQKLLPFKSEAA
jgi:hypothetical protein